MMHKDASSTAYSYEVNGHSTLLENSSGIPSPLTLRMEANENDDDSPSGTRTPPGLTKLTNTRFGKVEGSRNVHHLLSSSVPSLTKVRHDSIVIVSDAMRKYSCRPVETMAVWKIPGLSSIIRRRRGNTKRKFQVLPKMEARRRNRGRSRAVENATSVLM